MKGGAAKRFKSVIRRPRLTDLPALPAIACTLPLHFNTHLILALHAKRAFVHGRLLQGPEESPQPLHAPRGLPRAAQVVAPRPGPAPKSGFA